MVFAETFEIKLKLKFNTYLKKRLSSKTFFRKKIFWTFKYQKKFPIISIFLKKRFKI